MAGGFPDEKTIPHPFPRTQWSLIWDSANRKSETWQQSLERFSTSYWRPVYTYFRKKWSQSREEAMDLTQDFFTALLERNTLETLSPERGRFRTYVKIALDNYVRLRHRGESAQKRGGGMRILSLNNAEEGFDVPAEETADQAFSREWAGSIFQGALSELEQEYRKEGKETTFEIFRLYDLEQTPDQPLSYEDLARKFGLPETSVTYLLYAVRQRFKAKVRERVRETVSSESELETELRELFGEGSR